MGGELSFGIAGGSSLIPPHLFADHLAKADNLRVIRYSQEEHHVEHGVVYRIEFRETRCNVTLKNSTAKKQSVNVRIWVLNSALITLWEHAIKWSLTSLQPDQMSLQSVDFKTVIPAVVWNSKARSEDPAWIVISAE